MLRIVGTFLTVDEYSWAEAATACDIEFPGEGLVFAVPVNGYQNAKLHDLKTGLGIGEAWINYSDQSSENNWRPYDGGL